MSELIAFITNNGVPVTGPSGVDIPEIQIRNASTGGIAQASVDMTEVGDGFYRFTFAPADGVEYAFRVDGDPDVSGQTTQGERFISGVISGTTVARSEVDVPAILVDTDALAPVPADLTTLLARLTAARADNLDEITATRLAELDAANMPADIATLLARLTIARAANLDEITAARLAELDAANMPADLDTVAANVVLSLARLNGELVDVATFLGVVLGTPAVHTTTTITAGAQTYTVGVIGSTATITRTA